MKCFICKKEYNPVKDQGEPIYVELTTQDRKIGVKVTPCAFCYTVVEDLAWLYLNGAINTEKKRMDLPS